MADPAAANSPAAPPMATAYLSTSESQCGWNASTTPRTGALMCVRAEIGHAVVDRERADPDQRDPDVDRGRSPPSPARPASWTCLRVALTSPAMLAAASIPVKAIAAIGSA